MKKGPYQAPRQHSGIKVRRPSKEAKYVNDAGSPSMNSPLIAHDYQYYELMCVVLGWGDRRVCAARQA